MFDLPSFRIGSIFGVPIEVNASWFIIFGLLVFALATSMFPEVAVAAAAPIWLRVATAMGTALLFFGSILAHELSHSFVVRAQGGRVDRITLFIFGGVARMDSEPETPWREFLMAAAGPAMSIILAVLFGAAFSLSKVMGAPWWMWVPLEYLAGVNFFVGVFNLLPGFPLDGGRILRSVMWGVTHDLLKATKWASRAGQAIGWLMVAVAVSGVLQGETDLIWLGLVGWFVASLAADSYRQQLLRSRLTGTRVRDLMTAKPQSVSGELSLDRLVHDHFLGAPHSRYPVLYGGEVVGLVTLDDVKTVARDEWPFVTTLEIANRDVSHFVVDADAPADTAAAMLAAGRPGALLVSDGGRLAGIVTRADIIELLHTGPNR